MRRCLDACSRFCPALVLALLVWSEAFAAAAEPRYDRHGDPLPEGALARLGTIRQRVVAPRLAFSADGRTVLAVAGGHAISRFDAATGRLHEVRRLPGRPVSDCWLSADARLLALNEDKRLAVFSTATGVRTRLLPVQPMRAAFRPDGKVLVTGEYEKALCRLRLWDLETGKDHLLAQLPSYANDLVFSADGKRLFAAVDNHSLRCWDVDEGKELWKNDHWASGLAIAPDGRALCSSGYLRPVVYLWDAATGKLIRSASVGKGIGVFHLVFAPDGRTVFLQDGKDVVLWDAQGGVERRRLSDAGDCYALAPDGKTLAAVRGSLLHLWDVQTGRLLFANTTAAGHTSAVCGLAFSPDGRGLASSGADGTLRLWDLATQRPHTLRDDVPRHMSGFITWAPESWRSIFLPQALAFTPDGRQLLCEAGYSRLHTVDASTGAELRRFDVRRAKEGAFVSTARLSADGKTLWALTHAPPQPSSTVVFEISESFLSWDVATGKHLSTQAVKCSVMAENVIAPDGQTVALAGGDVRDVVSGKERLQTTSRRLEYPFAFSADSHLLAASDNRGSWNALAVYELLTGRLLRRFEAPIGWSSCFAFSPEGRLLVVAGRDALHVWEVSTGRRLLHLPAEGRLPAWSLGIFATALAVSPDGRTAATGHEDGTVLLWDLRPAWRQLARGPAPALTAQDVKDCWADLCAEDPRTAHAALDRLTAAPAQALPLLRKELRPVTVSEHWLADRLAALDSDDFAVREKASRDLEGVREAVQARLQRALEKTVSLEVQRRLRRLLRPRPLLNSVERVRRLRAVMALERIGSADARALLEDLARGEESDPLTVAARGALVRLTAAALHEH